MSDSLSQAGSRDVAAARECYAEDMRAAPGIVGNPREPLPAQVDFIETLRSENARLERIDSADAHRYAENAALLDDAAAALREPSDRNVLRARRMVREVRFLDDQRQRSNEARAWAASMPEPSMIRRPRIAASVDRSP